LGPELKTVFCQKAPYFTLTLNIKDEPSLEINGMLHLDRKRKRVFTSSIQFTILVLLSPFAFAQTAATFDINRYSTFGEVIFETLYVDELGHFSLNIHKPM